MTHSQDRRVLISTLHPSTGGVPAMTKFIAKLLKKQGFEPVLAYYEPYSISPKLSVPSYALLRRGIGSKQSKELDDCEAHGIGAWLPELEFTHYMRTKPWKERINSCDFHIMVSGSAVPLLPFYQSGIPYLGWVATGWEEDVEIRVKGFSVLRKLLHTCLNAPVMRALERRVLKKGHILALSEHTERVLNDIAGKQITKAVLPMPIDTQFFLPNTKTVKKGRVGFSARLDDPRKNITLLLRAIGILVERAIPISLDLIGGKLSEDATSLIEELGIKEHVNIISYIPKEELAKRLQSLDLYVLPSHQEGLCIAALEAMACGCPVVSTRCGGPEEYVIDDQTGFLVDFNALQMADAIQKITTNRSLRSRLSKGARKIIDQRYNEKAASSVFWENFEIAFTEKKGKL